MLKTLDELLDKIKSGAKKRIVIAAAESRELLKAVIKAHSMGIARPVLVGDKPRILEELESLRQSESGLEICHEPDRTVSCTRSVMMIRENEADILMKGMVPTNDLLKSVLDPENGIRKCNVLSHFALLQVPGHPKLLGISDAAVNICPGMKEKKQIIINGIHIFHKLGNPSPKVAVLAPVETVNTKIPSTLDAALLSTMNRRNQITGCAIDGPLAIDIAISATAAKQKGIEGSVAGDADFLVVPDLNSGNILYKSLVFLAGGTTASVIAGAEAPIVLTSRADTESTKFMSIALAAALD